MTQPETAEDLPDIETSSSTDWVRRFLTFVAVGLAATVLHGAVAWVLVGAVGGMLANTIGFIVALSITYLGNYRFTFRSEADHGDALVRFLVVSAITLALSQWVLQFLRSMGAEERTSLLLAVVAIPLLRFGVLATQVFGEQTSKRPLIPWLLDIAVWVLAVGFGVIALLSVSPAGFLDAGSELWRFPSGDRGTGVAGMRYFLADDWHWPLLVTDDLGGSEGTNIAFTDSIPLMALVAKLARPLIGSDVNYFPSWFLLIYSLQGVGGVALLRSLGVKRRDALVVGALLAVTFPAFTFRAFHPALGAHFILLFALAAAFSSGGNNKTTGEQQRRWRVATGLALVVALLIHPYLLFTVSPLVAGVFVDHWRNDRLSLGEIVTTGVGTVAGLLAVLGVGGYLGSHSASVGYGTYGLNVLGPIYPQLSGLLPGEEPVLSAGNDVRWEAFNWLGFGALGLVAVAVIVALLRERQLMYRWLGLVVMTVVMTGIAVSHEVTYGRAGVIDIQELIRKPVFIAIVLVSTLMAGVLWFVRQPSRTVTLELLAVAGLFLVGSATAMALGPRLLAPLSAVRTSGRLWWPIGLLIVLGSVAIVARSVPRWLPVLFLVVVTAQVIDTQPVRSFANTTMAGSVDVAGIEILAHAIENSMEVRVSPTFFCAPYPDGVFEVLNAVVVAADSQVPIDTAYTARAPKDVDCTSGPEQELVPGELRVLVLPDRRDPGALLDGRHRCRDNGQVLVCTEQWSGLDAGAVAPFLPVIAEPVTFGQGGDSDLIMVEGWGDAEVWGREILPSGTTVSIPLLGVESGDELLIRFRLRTIGPEPGVLNVGSPGSTEQAIDVLGPTPQNYELHLLVGFNTPDTLELNLSSAASNAIVGIDEMTVLVTGN